MDTNPMLLPSLLAGLLASLACGIIGPYVITRRIVFLSGAIAHIALGGIGAAVFAQWMFPDYRQWLLPLYGAAIAALLAAVLIGVVHERMKERMDTMIGAMWAIGMATGLLLLRSTGGYRTNLDLQSYLFGNIATVGWSDVWLMAGLNVIIIITVLLFHKRFLAVCLDKEQAQLQGINVLATDIVLLCLVALTVICLIQIVGLIMVIALLALPAATANHYLARMGPIMLISVLLCMLITTLPRISVYSYDLPAEPTIVLSAGGVYLVSVVVMRFRRSAS
jgi:zinc transport system permease protein